MGNWPSMCPEPVYGLLATFNGDDEHFPSGGGIVIQGVSYATIKLIGEGGYAFVYEGINSTTGQRVALKRYAFSEMSQQQDAMEEVSIYTSVCPHDNIVTYFDSEILYRPRASMPEMWVVMELCAGPSLQDYINNRITLCQTFTVHEVYEIADNLIQAIGHLHGQSPPVSHWDIKPDNFLFTQSGALKLCDFGSATRVFYAPTNPQDISVAELELESRLTLLYRSPESVLLWDNKRVDTKVDMWALGVILYVLVFTEMPFDANAVEISTGVPRKYRSSGNEAEDASREDPCPEPFRPLMKLVRSMLLVKNPEERADIFKFSAELSKLTNLPALEAPRPGFQSAQRSRF